MRGWRLATLVLLGAGALALMGWARWASPLAAGDGYEYEVTVQFNDSVTQDGLNEVDAILRSYDEGLSFLIQESFPPTGRALLTTAAPDFCPKIEGQLEAKPYVADVVCGEQQDQAPSSDADEPVTSVPGGRESSAIQEVVDRHTPIILGIDGVVGMGAGECGADPCIKVMLEKDTPDLRQRIPGALEGYKVDVEVTGPIEALPLEQESAESQQRTAAESEDDSWASTGIKAGLAIAGLAAVTLMAAIGWRLWAVRRASGR